MVRGGGDGTCTDLDVSTSVVSRSLAYLQHLPPALGPPRRPLVHPASNKASTAPVRASCPTQVLPIRSQAYRLREHQCCVGTTRRRSNSLCPSRPPPLCRSPPFPSFSAQRRRRPLSATPHHPNILPTPTSYALPTPRMTLRRSRTPHSPLLHSTTPHNGSPAGSPKPYYIMATRAASSSENRLGVSRRRFGLIKKSPLPRHAHFVEKTQKHEKKTLLIEYI